jgi:hypothetical protein
MHHMASCAMHKRQHQHPAVHAAKQDAKTQARELGGMAGGCVGVWRWRGVRGVSSGVWRLGSGVCWLQLATGATGDRCHVTKGQRRCHVPQRATAGGCCAATATEH